MLDALNIENTGQYGMGPRETGYYRDMDILLVLLILAILLGLGGAFLHVLWYVAIVVALLWVIGRFTGRNTRL